MGDALLLQRLQELQHMSMRQSFPSQQQSCKRGVQAYFLCLQAQRPLRSANLIAPSLPVFVTLHKEGRCAPAAFNSLLSCRFARQTKAGPEEACVEKFAADGNGEMSRLNQKKWPRCTVQL